MNFRDHSAHKYCRDGPTVTQALAENTKLSPAKAARKLYPKPFILKRLLLRFQIKHDLYKGRPHNDLEKEDLDEAERSGRFPYRPSDLFLKIYSDSLLCLTRDPLGGLVSPPLMGSSAVMPLSIISVIPDIMRHYAHCIVNAEKQVLLATNYLQPSESQKTIMEALKELSRRVEKRGQKEKVVVKLIYDRGELRQLFNNHVPVLPGTKGWKDVALPDLSEIPNLDIEVINFHRVLLGTFHAKFMIVDRKLCLLNSNNIQDRPNVEMMIHLEGPVVDSFIDTFFLSWSNALVPPPPSLISPSSVPSTIGKYTFASENSNILDIEFGKAAKAARAILKKQGEGDQQNLSALRKRMERRGTARGGMMERMGLNGSRESVVDREEAREEGEKKEGFAGIVDLMMEKHGIGRGRKEHGLEPPADGESEKQNGGAGVPAITVEDHSEATDNHEKPSNGNAEAFTDSETAVDSQSTQPQKHSTDEVDQSPSPPPVAEEKKPAQIDGMDESDSIKEEEREEVPPAPGQEKTSGPSTRQEEAKQSSSVEGDETFDSQPAIQKRMKALSDALNVGTIRKTHANVEDDSFVDEFRPHVLHKEHAPFPIALVNRKPHGMPGHQDIRTPQNAAWLAGFRYAQKKIFIQTPTLNASPVVRACIDTARRGVQVILYLDLGFNDKGESIPFQGGTNQQVVVKMYKELKKDGKEEFLDVYWYTGKDQIRPISAIYKSRNCHVKFMVIDDQVGIQGNGNQDTQSWFHSEEVNVLVDSPQIVREWMEALDTNQNTKQYGRVGRDGIWHDSLGRTVSFYDDEATKKEEELKRHEANLKKSAKSKKENGKAA
ncbi:hypothetical protein JAAARDRAFT_38135 [Jaapia argillacea MUCL 33604]|uniref:PLD phosphodiesterase domain-containing protein n=1 Tax=Jaapia argillacea MUCL 33604 TaxID=933084 RepID=A0A067PT66_9AGAM|nr:hypothetical protein JAAARDRAFT_38135 [Jaapia argillacea MUCL 33604]